MSEALENTELDVEKRMVERNFVVIDGHEFPVNKLLNLLKTIDGDGGISDRVMVSGIQHDIAEVLHDIGLIGKASTGAYYPYQNDDLERMRQEICRKIKKNNE